MKTCWHDNKITPGEMILGANGKYWPKLSESQHTQILKELISIADKKRILDLGCGAAELSTVLPESCLYCGADLPHIIDLVSEKLHPNLCYIKCDVENDDLKFLLNYDLIIMNALIDVLDKPLEVLSKVLSFSTSDVLIHRQEVGIKTSISICDSYGGKTYKSTLSRIEFDYVVKHNGFIIKEERVVFGPNQFSFLLEMKK